MVSLPSRGRSRLLTASLAPRRNALLLTVLQQRFHSRPLFLVTRLMESALLISLANLADCLGVNGTMAATRDALTPLASCRRATARKTTRTCCTPRLRSFPNSFLSPVVTSMHNAARAIPKVWCETFRMELSY